MAEQTRFRPAHRLSRAIGFSGVFANRRVLRGVLFDLHYRPNSIGTARLGVVIPKRNAKRAVLRNRFKRVARELFRRERESLPLADLVLRLVRPVPPASLDNSVLREDMMRLLSRLPPDLPR